MNLTVAPLVCKKYNPSLKELMGIKGLLLSKTVVTKIALITSYLQHIVRWIWKNLKGVYFVFFITQRIV